MIASISLCNRCIAIAANTLGSFCLALLPTFARAQEEKAADLAHAAQMNQTYNMANRTATTLPAGIADFFAKDGLKGSPYLVQHWLSGSVQFSGNGFLPGQDSLGFNYDKINHLLVATRDGRTTLTVPGDHIISFTLTDSSHVYQFEKLPVVSTSDFFQPLVRSAGKYALYKQILTKMHEAEYTTVGYTSYGKRYDEITDSYSYLLIAPDGKSFKRLSLNKHSIRSAFPSVQAKAVDEFFAHQDGPVTEEMLTKLVENINGK